MKPVPDQFEQPVPQDIEAEMCVIGSMMLDRDARYLVRAIIDRNVFMLADHQILFDVMGKIDDEGGSVDAITVRAALRSAKIYEDIGADGYVGKVLDKVPSSAHAEHYARIVRDRHVRRETISFSADLHRRVMAATAFDNAADIVHDGLQRLSAIASGNTAGESCSISEVLVDVRQDLSKKELDIYPTGFQELDEFTGGIGSGEMVIVGARPSMGKSLLLRQAAAQIAMMGFGVGYISLEEGKRKIGRNLLSTESGVENKKIRSRQLSQQEMHEVESAIVRLRELPIYLSDSARKIGDIKAKANIWKARYGIHFLIIDYLQRIHSEGKDRYERVSNASQAVSDLIKDLGLRGIVAVQLNRALANREDKRPGMSDIRESGQIEQDADGIIFLHREDYYHIEEPQYQPTGMAELIISKWRDGERGKIIRLKSDLKHQRFLKWEGQCDRNPVEGAFD